MWIVRAKDRNRGVAIALAVSVGLHVAAMVGMPDLMPAPIASPSPERIIVRVAAIPAPAPVAKPAPPPEGAAAPRPRAAPQPRAAAKPRRPPVAPAPIALPDPTPREPADIAPPDDAPTQVAADEPVTPAPPTQTASAEGAAPAEATAEPSPAPMADASPTPVSPAGGPYPLRSARLVYDLSYGANPLRVGRVVHLWSNDGERYFAETTIEATGILALLYGGQYIQRSWGGFGAGGLVPSEYYVQRGRPDRAETARFEWEDHQVAFARPGDRGSATLATGTQDPISILHQLYFLQPMAQAQRFQVATSRKIAAYDYQHLGQARVETPAGTIDAIHLRRTDDESMSIDLWIDPARSYLPVRIHYVDSKGVVFDQRLREITVEEMPAASTQAQPPAREPAAGPLARR